MTTRNPSSLPPARRVRKQQFVSRLATLGSWGVLVSAILVLNLCSGFSGWAADISESAVRSALETIRERHKLPAMGGAIVTSDGAIAIAVAGTDSDGTLLHTDVPWHLGSCGKAMTATVAATLVQEGLLRWDSTLGETFLENEKQMSAHRRAITLRELLTHRAGLEANALWGLMPTGGVSAARAATVLISSDAAEASRVSGFLYSNAGYVIAGAMMERITGRTWETLMEERLFRPLGMEGCGFGAAKNGPWPHTESGEAIDPALPYSDNLPVMGPAGTMHAPLAAWARFVAEHLRAAEGLKTKLLNPDSYHTLQTPPEGGDYAMGWVQVERSWGGGRVLTHGGSNTLNQCVVWMAPAKDFAVMATTNQGGEAAAKACDEVASRLIGLWLDCKRGGTTVKAVD